MKNDRLRKVSPIAIAMIGCLALFLMLAGGLFAQERTGLVQGTITDATGAAVPGAAVELSGGSLIRPLTVTSDSAGAYLFASVPPGEYSLSVTAKGFSTTKRAGVPVATARTARVDVRLEVGTLTESVVVEAAGAVVDTATNVISTNITSDMYDRLPKGRSFDSLVLMAPGVRNEGRGGGYQVDGASGSENVYVLDGVETTNFQNGTLDRQAKVPIEWVGETNIKSSGSDAQFGGSTGGVITANTKSGSNEFHGQVSMYYTTDNLNAGPRASLRLDPNAPVDTAEYFFNKKDDYRNMNPGYSLGGRIIRDRLWFFSSYFPQFERWNRNVNFVTGQTGQYERNDRSDYWLNRVDYMPLNNLRLNFAYNYSPYKVNGLLPTQQGTDAFSAPWADRGYRAPYTTYNYQADWTASSKFLLSAFGGYSYRNYKDYGIPRGTRYRNSTSAIGIDGVNPAFSRGVGDVTPDNRQTTQDINERTNLNVVASYLFNAGGQHNLKGGWQLNRLANRPFGNTWADGYVQMYWNRSYSAVTIPNPAGGFRGKYGYYRVIPFILQGDTASNNQAMFFNDAWRINKYLQLNLGLRFEKEYVPSFANSALGLPSKAITFGWGDKIAPRLGFAWDPSGVGKMKIYGSWGLYYDMMKYELPRGSFGGEFWIDRYYTLDTGNPFDIKPEMGSAGVTGTFPGTLIESLNRRIPSNDPSENLIDPNLKPVRQSAMDFGYEYSLTDKSLLAFRYTFKKLDRTIEDVGILTSLGEQYFIANPGYGVTVDESLWPKGYPTDVTPKAKRTYNALEVRFEKRYANNFALSSSYVWSRLYGNYGGLASSDENGRTSPNVNRYFDLPWMAYDRNGKPSYGLLPTDRPHTFKFFASYDLKSKIGVSRFSPVFQAYSGTVLSTEVEIDGVPIYYSYKRGDLGRTPIFTQMDFLYTHDFPGFKESQKFRFEFNVTNLLNSGTPLNKFNTLPNLNDSAAGITFDDTAQIFKGYDPRKLMQEQGIGVDPRFMWDNSYQAPRDIRLGIHFIF